MFLPGDEVREMQSIIAPTLDFNAVVNYLLTFEVAFFESAKLCTKKRCCTIFENFEKLKDPNGLIRLVRWNFFLTLPQSHMT